MDICWQFGAVAGADAKWLLLLLLLVRRRLPTLVGSNGCGYLFDEMNWSCRWRRRRRRRR